MSLIYVFFSFLLQSCLAIFCVTEVLEDLRSRAEEANSNYYYERKQIQIQYVILASLGSCFGFLSQLSEFRNAYKVYNFYGKLGVLQSIDFMVNVILPLLIIIVGFWLIANQENFVDAVIMTTALLFIPEIDDQLPSLLGFDPNGVIETYLVRESKNLYNNLIRRDDDDLWSAFDSYCASYVRSDIRLKSSKMGMEFSDYYITNPNPGTETAYGSLANIYNPKESSLKLYSIDYNPTYGHEISPSNFISEDCLIQTVEWVYKDETNARSISWLKLVKMNGEIIEKKYSSKSKLGELHRINGAFVITDIVMETSCISTFRLCGSEAAQNFKEAIYYYSLWDITAEAKYLLKNHDLYPNVKKITDAKNNDQAYRSMI